MQNAQGGVTETIIRNVVNEKVIQFDSGSGKTAEITNAIMNNIRNKQGKVYGKRGRRIRAAERLSIGIDKQKSALKFIENDLSILEKKNKLSMKEKETYNELLYIGNTYYNGLPRMEKELATLKSRV